MRKRREEPLGFTEQILHGDSMDNVDADLMAAVYNPAHPLFLNAYIRGKQHKDLRFLIRIRVGAVPQLDSPEEVALINYDPEGMQDGIWYLDHLLSEFEKKQQAPSRIGACLKRAPIRSRPSSQRTVICSASPPLRSSR